jgi:hypothetical protein
MSAVWQTLALASVAGLTQSDTWKKSSRTFIVG